MDFFLVIVNHNNSQFSRISQLVRFHHPVRIILDYNKNTTITNTYNIGMFVYTTYNIGTFIPILYITTNYVHNTNYIHNGMVISLFITIKFKTKVDRNYQIYYCLQPNQNKIDE